MTAPFRRTTQTLAPAAHSPTEGEFNIYPGYPVGPGRVGLGFASLAGRLAGAGRVVIDGMGGVLWDDFRARLASALDAAGLVFDWYDARDAVRPPPEVDALVAPFLGGSDPLFGTRNLHPLADFFVPERLADIGRRASASRHSIVYGTGAALVPGSGLLVYVDVPKNEIQFRSRAGAATNLGARDGGDSKAMYKRFYFADWPPLRAHQGALLARLDVIVDGQRPDEPTWMSGDELRAGLAAAAHTWFRVRPWFEPGPWGGQWMKRRFRGLPEGAPNLAWSFELISPENGLAFESDGRLLEIAFDWLMFRDPASVLGDFADRYEHEFPIRFDYLDTFDGGNLSVQCHPRPEYAWRQFGERFTQDESYYLTDTSPGARVFLGFQAGVDRDEFRRALDASVRETRPFDVDRYVQSHPAERHGLYLIPHGTIHAAGRGNLVLEISATPYIFTFKMYDWLRMDLDGRPRTLAIERAMANLCFERQGAGVRQELISVPRQIECGDRWTLEHLPTHADQLYDVHRICTTAAFAGATEGSPHVLNVVDGPGVTLDVDGAAPRRFAYAETFVVPAAAGRYRLVSHTGRPVAVVKCFLKPHARHLPDYLQG